MKKEISKEEIKLLIDQNDIVIFYDDTFRYWNTGDDYRTCSLLEAVHSIEKKGGYIIHIPGVKEKK